MNHRARLLDIIDRSLEGPILSEEDFDMKRVAKGIKSVVKKYDIKIKEGQFLVQDDDLLDRVWNAAIEFFAKCGIYSKDTGRVIEFTEEEVRYLIRQAPDCIVHGEGRDRIHLVSRVPDDKKPPINISGPCGNIFPNEYLESMTISYMQEPLVDSYCTPTGKTFRGREIRTRGPLEILSAYDEMLLFKNCAKLAGRAGIHTNAVNGSVSDIGQLTGGEIMGKNDSHCVGIISEMKTDNTILNKIAYGVISDKPISAYANPIFGGLGGGLEGQIVLLTAEMIMCSIVFCSDDVSTTPTHPFLFVSTTKEMLQEMFVAVSAITRNSKIMTNSCGVQAGGPGTKTLLYETITSGIVAAKSGCAQIFGPRGACGVAEGGNTGLEGRFQGEVIRAACQISMEKAEEIMGLAYDKYKDDLDKKPYGVPYWEAYDVATVKPMPFWQQMYEEVKAEAIAWGLPMNEI